MAEFIMSQHAFTISQALIVLFGIPGNYTPAQIVTHLTWLIRKKGIVKFRGVDLEVSSV
jgi:peroxiredoxin